MNKEKQVRFRLEQNDWERLEKRAKDAGMSVSKYIRACVLMDAGDLTMTDKIQQELKKYYGIISRLGSNVNQLTREVNTGIKSLDKNSNSLLSVLTEIKPQIDQSKSLLSSVSRQTRI